MTSLFDPVRLGAIESPNRILMAPLTRSRATRDHVPTPIMADYYRQRASAGLIISEATGISRQGLGWPFAPGLWSAQQVEAWKPVTQAVHQAGGRIFAQLWHMGRLVHSSVSGQQPVAPSAIAAPGTSHTYDGKQPYETPRALGLDEIPALVETYAAAARNAMSAGFDGVQIHAANGYLIDEFLRNGANQRDDDYGGSPENRARLLREVTQAVAAEVGADRTAVRLSPNGMAQGTDDSDPASIFAAAAQVLQDIGIAFLELREPGPQSSFSKTDAPPQSPLIRSIYKGPLVLNSDFDETTASAAIAEGRADAVSFGRPFLANPDLPLRLRHGKALNAWDVSTFYTQDAKGYLDYPTLQQAS